VLVGGTGEPWIRFWEKKVNMETLQLDEAALQRKDHGDPSCSQNNRAGGAENGVEVSRLQGGGKMTL